MAQEKTGGTELTRKPVGKLLTLDEATVLLGQARELQMPGGYVLAARVTMGGLVKRMTVQPANPGKPSGRKLLTLDEAADMLGLARKTNTPDSVLWARVTTRGLVYRIAVQPVPDMQEK